MTKDEPQCNKLMKIVQKTVATYENKPIIYLVTPTYERPVQKAELTRMSHTLLLVWCVFFISVYHLLNIISVFIVYINMKVMFFQQSCLFKMNYFKSFSCLSEIILRPVFLLVGITITLFCSLMKIIQNFYLKVAWIYIT